MSDSLQQPSPYPYVDSIYSNGTADNKCPVTLEDAVKLLNWFQKELGECRAALTASQDREGKLREALGKYAHHRPSCDIEDDARKPCTCGLTAALKECE